MRHECVFALLSGILAAGTASPQSLPSDLVTYLNLTDAQTQSITSMNIAFEQSTNSQQQQYYDLQSQAGTELANPSPDPGVVGNLYGQMISISRAYNAQLGQVQANIATVLTPAQATLVASLLQVARLQTLVYDAQQVYMETTPTQDVRSGNFSGLYLVPYEFATSLSAACCSAPTVPIDLANYFNLSDAQVSAIQNAILENQNLAGGESAQIQELQYAIQTLEAAQTIDTATLGADYVQIAQIQAAEATQTTQLIATVRSVLTDPQQPLLAALDNAMSLSQIEGEAVSFSILALPSSLGQTYTFFNFGGFPIGTVY